MKFHHYLVLTGVLILGVLEISGYWINQHLDTQLAAARVPIPVPSPISPATDIANLQLALATPTPTPPGIVELKNPIRWNTQNTISISTQAPQIYMTISHDWIMTIPSGQGSVVIDCKTGKVDIRNTTAEEGARHFWEAVGHMFQDNPCQPRPTPQ